MKRKGFTLIELLAVIVILAIIALIATPMIMDVIERARKGAAEESGNGYIEAVEWYQLEQKLDSSAYQIPTNTEVKINACESTCLRDLIEVKGGKPSGENDYIKLNDKGTIEEGKLTFGNYEVIIKDGKVESTTKIGETSTEVTFEPTLGNSFMMSNLVIDSEGPLWAIEFPISTEPRAKIKEDTRFISVTLIVTEGDAGIYGIDENKNLLYIPFIASANGIEIGDSEIIKAGTKFKVVSATTHIMAIDESGNLWNINLKNEDESTIIKVGTKFKSVSEGVFHTIAIDEAGNLWDINFANEDESTIIKEGTKFKSASADGMISLAIDEAGNLWDINFANGDESTIIKEGTKFKSVSAGEFCAMIIDVDGNLWGVGFNKISGGGLELNGLLGIGTEEAFKDEPVKIKEGTYFKNVNASMYNTLAIDTNNNLWMWGTNTVTMQSRLEPELVMNLKK